MTLRQNYAPALLPNALTELDAHWWDTFIKTTQQVSETAVLPNALASDTVAGMLHEVMRVIRSLCLRQSDGGGFFRAYLNDQKVPPAQMPDRIFAHPPLPGESVTDWAARAYGETPFCLIFNYADLLSDRLCQQLSRLIQPFLAQWGIPLNGLHTTTFVGNYGYTPLGVHQDSVGGNVIHFHLGPGKKTMYTWEADDYNRLTNSGQNKPGLQQVLPHATAYEFGAGDIYYMPWNKYHIGYSDQLSVGVTLWFDNHTNDVVFWQLLQTLRDRLFDPAQACITQPEQLADRPGNSFSVIDALVAAGQATDFNRPFEDVLRDEYEHHMRRLVSNSGWKVSPNQRTHPLLPDNTDHLDRLLTSQLQLVSPFRLLHVPLDAQRIQVYCRGDVLTTHKDLLPILDRLNTGESISTTNLLDLLDTDQWNEVITLLMALHNRCGLTLSPLS